MGKTVKLSGRIIKAMGLFTGVQAVMILLSIVRTKLVAVWLGPAGVNAIFISTQELLVSAVGLNLRTGGVRELSAAPASERSRRMGVLLRVAMMLAVGGCVATVALSPALSYWTLSTTSEWWCFALLGVGVGAGIYLDADLAALQAAGKLKALARVSFAASLACTLVSVPLYYGLRLQAVLPVYLLMTVVYALWARRERRLCCPAPVMPGYAEAWRSARPMLRLGIFLTVAAVVGRLTSYLFVVFMSRFASEGELGVYQAGFTLINTYVGVIFTALSTEYYPRLASVSASRMRMEVFVAHEFKIVARMLMPLMVVFLIADKLMVRVLYAESFMPLLPYVDIAVCGMALRAFSFCVAYVVLARGDGRMYVFLEGTSEILGLVLKIGGYMLWGFAGLGVAYVVEYLVYGCMVVCIYRRYGMRFRGATLRLCAGATALGFAALMVKYIIQNGFNLL